MSAHTTQPRQGRPSRWWTSVSIVTAIVAASLMVAAVVNQRSADRPVGEGELFRDDAAIAEGLIMSTFGMGMDADEAVRHVRNQLTVEVVSVVDPAGTVIDSTSGTLLDSAVENGLLQFGHFDRRFVAVAAPLEAPVEVDGVVEWAPGDVLYHALQPLDEGSSLLLSYDITELFERRARAAGIQPATIQLLGVGAFFATIAAALLVGRGRASRRYEQMELEAEFLRTRSADLEAESGRAFNQTQRP